MKRLINSCFLYLLLISMQARATPLLTGSVSFDDLTDLYIYTYIIDATQNDTITELSILQNLGFHYSRPLPVSHTEPEGWNFVIAAGGISEPVEDYIRGSFWTWQRTSEAPDLDPLTFSFTTERGVNTTELNNYFIFDPYGTSGPPAFPGVTVGRIVGPEFVTINEVSPVPENEILTMMMTGLGMLGYMARRAKRRTKSGLDR